MNGTVRRAAGKLARYVRAVFYTLWLHSVTIRSVLFHNAGRRRNMELYREVFTGIYLSGAADRMFAHPRRRRGFRRD